MDSSRQTSLKIGAKTMVCEKSRFSGNVTLGERCVVHPQARIIAEAGPIIMGDGNLVEEQALIYNRLSPDSRPGETVTMEIGNNNVFEVASYTESLKIGDNNVLEPKARVGRDTQLGNGCIIGSMCEVTCPQVIADKTVVYGSRCEHKIQHEKPAPQTLQLEFLSKLLPSYHHMDKGHKATPPHT